MRKILVALVWFWSVEATAKPLAPSPAQELSKEARALFDQAAKETDPTKADELRKEAGEKWSAAYESSRDADYLLAIGLCHGMRKDYSAAIVAYRTFLMVAPLTAQEERIIAEQYIEHYRDALAALATQNPPAFVITDPIPITFDGSFPALELKEVMLKKEEHPWRKPLAITGGALGGAGVIAAFVVRGVLNAQSQINRDQFVTEERP